MYVIKGNLIDVSGSQTDLGTVQIRSESIRANGEDNLVTGESVIVPVSEDGSITFTAVEGPAVMTIFNEPGAYSRSGVIPLWIPAHDTTLAEAYRLGIAASTDATDPVIQDMINALVAKAVEELDLEGVQGPQGEKGEPGEPGQPGEPGEPGEKGEKGEPGLDGVDGKDGEPGASAYEVWISDGNTGTETEFLSSLKGEDGQDGRDGEDGQDGEPGASAYEVWISDGNTGTETDFLSSLKGEPGQDGQDGKDGEDGISPHIDETTGNWHLGDQDTGVKAQGSKGDQGDPGPPGTTEWGGITDRPATFPPDIRIVSTVEEALNGVPGVWFAVEEA